MTDEEKMTVEYLPQKGTTMSVCPGFSEHCSANKVGEPNG